MREGLGAYPMHTTMARARHLGRQQLAAHIQREPSSEAQLSAGLSGMYRVPLQGRLVLHH